MAKAVTLQEFNRRIKERFPEEKFEILEYSVAGKPAIFKCCTCGKEISVSSALNFLAKNKRYGCVNCHGIWKDREKKLELIKTKYEIIDDSEIRNTHTLYTVKCKNCGHIRTTTLNNLIKNLECGCKTGTLRNRTAEEFINTVNKNHIDQYELVSEYTDQTTKVLLRHLNCGFIWSVRPSDVINNGKCNCPKCATFQSIGARAIEQVLKESGIPYEKEKQLENSKQRFDFYFEIKNNKIAIEYNGIQHMQYSKFFS